MLIIFLRKYRPSDCKTLAELFYNTIHIVNIKDYSKEQINAWADGNINLNEWNNSFLSHCTVVAEINKTITGFGDIDNTGYLDRLYVHYAFQRMGIATAICDELEKSVNSTKIITHASVTAKSFFEKRGYKTVKEQQVQRHNIYLTNYVMELPSFKDLSS